MDKILVLWCICIIILGRINKKSNILRGGFYAVLLLLPLALGFRISIDINKTVLIYSIIGAFGGLVLLLPKFKMWYLVLSYDLIGIKSRKPNLEYISKAVLIILGAIIEEFFYRGYIISNLGDSNILPIVFFSTFMFVLHPVNPNRTRNSAKKDKEIQIIFGAFSSIICILSGSIIPSIIAHIAYVSPEIALHIRSYIYWSFKQSNKS
ncbi:CPBP family intramembrane glutamic endopeptidase [Alkaliphilus hydrothermalis]|uniref:Membrane protease YdiL (CAAX protease family) n=1 Tax=Alkaliphilus hydrothermalis TaxID=1482730 RepID=A0ABS2NSD4_9FIRM|nr:CPBP family intramembrane glutamic endopeptidase [Alkaliphilus hydrothermalis]MBM7615863.1 membrane protease YdiL (CAAX protease family) [Alkaliphilus hydrothermalis]